MRLNSMKNWWKIKKFCNVLGDFIDKIIQHQLLRIPDTCVLNSKCGISRFNHIETNQCLNLNSIPLLKFQQALYEQINISNYNITLIIPTLDTDNSRGRIHTHLGIQWTSSLSLALTLVSSLAITYSHVRKEWADIGGIHIKGGSTCARVIKSDRDEGCYIVCNLSSTAAGFGRLFRDCFDVCDARVIS